MEVRLLKELTGKEIIDQLRRVVARAGLSVSYVPITIAFANVVSSERRVYERIVILGAGARLKLRAPDGRDRLEAGERYGMIILEGDDSSIASLTDFIERLPSGLVEVEQEKAREVGLTETGLMEVEYHRQEAKDYTKEFRVLVVVQGEYGGRIYENLKRRAPHNWRVVRFDLTTDLPTIVDDASLYIPESTPEADLVLFLSQHSNSPQLMGDLVSKTRARALIAPIDNSEWMPLGQVNQIKPVLERWGVEYAFPRPFCSLTEVGTPAIDEFARRFGRPIIEIESTDGKMVTVVRVSRGSPCGCTEFVAESVGGQRLDETVEKAALTHHHYPCLASMVIETDLNDTLMHASGFITKGVFDERVKRFLKKKIGYLDPSQFK